ncbi:AAA family ATPase [Salegentibacter sp. Hel_I_6]|uniref:AAA family ATPase n=1 Tax=Salegentibacter sp. Hel_I_6 TaxID=1250278 RepID=UPI0006906D22|nr:AAA family ATPase [Salegentibacter sp. Hel_I_6]
MDRKLDFLTKDLIDQAVTKINNNGIPSKRNGTGYAVKIEKKLYPYKLIVTEAAKLAEVELTSDDFNSNANNRLGFEKLSGYKIVDIGEMISFKNLENIVEIINKELGEFCSKFQYTRKKLLNKKSATNRDKLFIVSDKDRNRDWVINPGGGTEVQYHLFLRNGNLSYGIGFNTQYVPFANDKSTVDYIQPYVHSFLQQPMLLKKLKEEGFDFVIGNLEQLENLEHDNYVLIGKQFSIKQDQDFYKLPKIQFEEMIGELQGVLFKTYVDVMKQKKKFEKKSILKTMEDSRIDNYLRVLEYKKQIILQGPPGTGKTYTAKKMAEKLTGIRELKISESFIKENFEAGQKIENASGKKDFYTITEISDKGISMRSDNSRPWTATYDRVISKYEDFLNGKKPSNKNGADPYEIAIAQYLFSNVDTNEKGDYELIQFHPSYTYEDFVRGIEATSNGEKIEYKTRNKKIAKLSLKASENLENSQKSEEELNEKILLEERFESFIEMIYDKIDEEGKFPLTPSVSITGVEEDAFRYKGENSWNSNGNKMHFSDIKKAYLDNNTTRQEIKKNKTLSGLANWHASYYVRVLNAFQQFIEDGEGDIEVKPEEKNENLKKYVLIIDEINRANLPSVLGELIYALEYRGEIVNSMYEVNGKSQLVIPENLYIIGTMNTADRSVGHIDYAIRRRFSFVEILADSTIIQNQNAKKLFDEVSNLFITEKDGELTNSRYLASDFNYRDIQVGHSYFLVDPSKAEGEQLEELRLKLNYEIKPILKEYVNDGILLKDAEATIEKLSV